MERNGLLQLFVGLASELEPRDYSGVTEADVIANLGIDSLGLAELVHALEERLGIVVPEEKLAGVRTVGDLFDLLQEQRPQERELR
jgi:acyl carrier protein